MFSSIWKYHTRNTVRSIREEKGYFSDEAHANNDGRWIGSFWFIGWTAIFKEDITRDNHPTLYRAQPDYYGQPWFDWGMFHFAGKDNDTSCVGII